MENEIAQLKETNHLEEEQLHCDVTRCTAIAYKTCSGGDLCGTKNGISCAHIPAGLGNTGCAENALSPVQGLNNENNDENWVLMWTFDDLRMGDGTYSDGIAGVEISGGCSARIKESSEFSYEFSEVLLPGFTALQGREEIGEYDYYGEMKIGSKYMDYADKINLFCPKT